MKLSFSREKSSGMFLSSDEKSRTCFAKIHADWQPELNLKTTWTTCNLFNRCTLFLLLVLKTISVFSSALLFQCWSLWIIYGAFVWKILRVERFCLQCMGLKARWWWSLVFNNNPHYTDASDKGDPMTWSHVIWVCNLPGYLLRYPDFKKSGIFPSDLWDHAQLESTATTNGVFSKNCFLFTIILVRWWQLRIPKLRKYMVCFTNIVFGSHISRQWNKRTLCSQ